jgi:hypothetical protein
MISPLRIDKQSPLLGEPCALCRDPLSPGDEAVLCPEDGTRHHSRCWDANGNKCAAYGCMGNGEIVIREPESDPTMLGGTDVTTPSAVDIPPAAQGRLAHLLSNFSTGCLLLSIALAIILIAFSCFGIWAIADYILLEILGWQYRQPLAEGAGMYFISALALIRRRGQNVFSTTQAATSFIRETE